MLFGSYTSDSFHLKIFEDTFFTENDITVFQTRAQYGSIVRLGLNAGKARYKERKNERE